MKLTARIALSTSALAFAGILAGCGGAGPSASGPTAHVAPANTAQETAQRLGCSEPEDAGVIGTTASIDCAEGWRIEEYPSKQARNALLDAIGESDLGAMMGPLVLVGDRVTVSVPEGRSAEALAGRLGGTVR